MDCAWQLRGCVQVMGHCQAMLGMNAWVPTVRESGGSRDNLHLMATAGKGAAAYAGLKDGGADPARPEAALECGPFAGRAPRPRPDPAEAYAVASGEGASDEMLGVAVDEPIQMQRVPEAAPPAAGLYDGSSSVGASSL